MTDCIFCKIIAGEIPSDQIYEDSDFLAFLTLKPNNLGHALLVPKEHHINMFDLPTDILTKMGPVTQTLMKAIQTATGATGINIAMNNGSSAGQVVFHAHLHIIPRFEGDGYTHWVGHDYDTVASKAMAKKIKEKCK